ncbi:MAG: DUF4908 domain-containing protein [Brevundimonas sp.]|nr:MAG: DUF4908 domain-containing protein [Brevundimonas sp.]
MEMTAKVRPAEAPLLTAMAIALAAAVLSLSSMTGAALAQQRGNAQAEQSQALRNRGGFVSTPPPVGRYVAETGESFTLDRSGRLPLLRFDRRDETWVLRATPAPRGDVIYRNDAGDQVLRVTSSGGVTVFSPRSPGGSPASLSGEGQSLSPPTLGPAQVFNLMARRSGMLTQAVGRLVEVNVDTGAESEALTVEAIITTTDAVLRVARSPTARGSLNRLRSVTIVEGPRASVSYNGGNLRVVVAPSQGVAGRPSSARVIRALLPDATTTNR